MSVPAEMIAVEIAAFGGPEMLQPVMMPVPVPGPGEVLIRVAAAGLNAPDLGQRRGTYNPPADASPLPGLEVGGEIAALGPGVRDFTPGDPVVALTNGGGYAEYVAVPAGQVLPLPLGWSLLAGAALPETFFTVEQTLVMRAGLEAGMHVLIHGGAGGIGGAAIQRVKLAGAIPIAVVSDAAKAAYAQNLGAAEIINRKTEDFVARTLSITGGTGAERIVDIVGGDALDRNIRASARFGHIVLVSTQAGPKAEINAGLLMMKQLTLSGSTLRPQTREVKAAIAQSLRANVWPGLADGRIRPPRIRAVPLTEAARGHVELERSDNFGKLILITSWGETLRKTGGDADNPIESV
ncbi:NAD(P)H-quinone oxidoreductase [Devosia sp. ZB163]|uniref:NAD(P)H-quinone oxidoreductase n=1 Tax=Devosia sp. ZB163 TaxID=3025938 RepID=UPI002362D016|nr:NAD(P)H-quinone oxidoreductase [Devosia sp. ZB163]MDC9825052.1 NAD(P)H-quinone oxidoreductase [Devosia sp. ZB163]